MEEISPIGPRSHIDLRNTPQPLLPTVHRRPTAAEPTVSFLFNTGDGTIRVRKGDVSLLARVTTINFTPVIATRNEGKIAVYPIELLSERDEKRFREYEHAVGQRRVLTEFAYQPNPLALKQLRREVL